MSLLYFGENQRKRKYSYYWFNWMGAPGMMYFTVIVHVPLVDIFKR